ncbi:MAG TPA: aminotransferase class V-fold PLP-dependent enzyme, partial [bacterium]|nr:aminotransferase class V-fold PLP-dependent enzyme [bacterium]
RKTVADFIGAEPDDMVFVGSGSEANNTVLNLFPCPSVCCTRMREGRMEIITTAIEHPCVLETSRCLGVRGVDVHYLEVDPAGKIRLDRLREKLSGNTALVSVMMANNEIGTIQDIREIARIVHGAGAYFHTDAVQAVGKIPVNVHELDVDFLSFSAHKIYGPKGVGALYVRRGVHFCPLIYGGHQEKGRRAGTENTLGIIGLARAIEFRREEMGAEAVRLASLRKRLMEGITSRIPDTHINGHPEDVLPGTLNVSFAGVEGESILLYLDLEGIAVSTGSACSSGSLDPSHVLLATGASPELAHGSIRFSLGRDNTGADVDEVLDRLTGIIRRLRAMSTVYETA